MLAFFKQVTWISWGRRVTLSATPWKCTEKNTRFPQNATHTVALVTLLFFGLTPSSLWNAGNSRIHSNLHQLIPTLVEASHDFGPPKLPSIPTKFLYGKKSVKLPSFFGYFEKKTGETNLLHCPHLTSKRHFFGYLIGEEFFEFSADINSSRIDPVTLHPASQLSWYVFPKLARLTLPETLIAPKMMVSNRNLLFQGCIFRCHVSFREGKSKNNVLRLETHNSLKGFRVKGVREFDSSLQRCSSHLYPQVMKAFHSYTDISHFAISHHLPSRKLRHHIPPWQNC